MAILMEVQAAGLAIEKMWVAETMVASYLKAHPEDRRIPKIERPLVRPVQHWAQVLGVNRGDVQMLLVRKHQTTPRDYGYVSIEERWQLVSDRPFLVVGFRDHDEWRGEHANLHRWMTSARQIHKGELGQMPKLAQKPRVFPSSIQDPNSGKPWAERPNLNWVRLSELAAIVGLTMREIISGFAGFSPSTWYEPNVPLLCGTTQEEVVRIYLGQVPKSFCGGESYWGGDDNAVTIDELGQVLKGKEVLVPQSFAYTVIRLMQFGYLSENETPQNSFRLEAPMPKAPAVTLPALPTEELRELHDLRQSLPQELELIRFTMATGAFPIRNRVSNYADSLLFTDRPNLTDELNGFAYYTDFKAIQRHWGKVVIAICDWTRAGHDKSDNYWAGFLSVHQHQVNDPRRDPAELRIWFWPGECLRQSPAGSKGGLCPESIDPEIAVEVKDFLARLGYQA